MAYKGKFKPTQPNKYQGDVTKIIYRSLWELKVMRVFDTNPNFLMWMSEELAIPYYSPVDGKHHNYYPDFLIKMINQKKEIEVIMIEVKPLKQTNEPKIPKKKTRRFILEQARFKINTAKWDAAKLYCAEKGWKFTLMTEKDIF